VAAAKKTTRRRRRAVAAKVVRAGKSVAQKVREAQVGQALMGAGAAGAVGYLSASGALASVPTGGGKVSPETALGLAGAALVVATRGRYRLVNAGAAGAITAASYRAGLEAGAAAAAKKGAK